MIELIYSHFVFKLIISILLGTFLWIRHEMFAYNSNHKGSFMGVRTAALLCILWATSTFLEQIPLLPLIFLILIFLLIWIAYAYWAFVLWKSWLTTELSAILIFMIWVLIWYWEPVLAIILTIFLAAVDTFKDKLHIFASKLSEKEWAWAFEFLTISWAILPFLPQVPIDPWWVFVPFTFWLLVIVISWIWFVGYFLMKYLWTRAWITLTGFLWSLVSSTAVTVSMAMQSKKIKLPWVFAIWIFIAIATMQFRVILEILFIWWSMVSYDFYIIPVVMWLVWVFISIYLYLKTKKQNIVWKKMDHLMTIQSPFELMSAIKFWLLFVIILFSLKFWKHYFWNSWVYIISILSWITDVDAIVLSSIESLKLGEISLELARNSIAFAIVTNTIVKIVYVYFLWSRKLLIKVLIWVVLIVISSLSLFLIL